MTEARMLSTDALPQVRGKYLFDVALADVTWFRVGGPADVVFMPADLQDLRCFLAAYPIDAPLITLGAGSNTLARDGGVRGVVLRLGKPFAAITQEGTDQLRAGAAALDVTLARAAAKAGIAGLEFYRGIPGSIGGALRMNAGAYGSDTSRVLIRARAVDRRGELHEISAAEMGFDYRSNGVDDELIFVDALFQGGAGDPDEIEARMAEISASRDDSQPVRSRTGGSTFKNPGKLDPAGPKAWKLIDAAGCRGMRVGDAQVSEQHCNFLINHGAARAADIEALGEIVRARVAENSGETLHWEIKRIGEPTHD